MSTTAPLVSVILPNYNHLPFLQKRIDSILRQTFQDFELIILDDCSTDSSRELLDKYSNNFKVSQIIYNTTNSGSTFSQWQKGFNIAQGEYIWIAESDDYADATFLEKLVGELQQDSKNMIAFSKSHIIDSKGVLLNEDWDRTKVKEDIAVSHFGGVEFVKARMLFNNSIYNASMVVFRKSAIEGVNRQYSNLTYSGDWMFWIDICLQGNVIRYNEKLSYFRQHQQKVTPRAEAKGIRFSEGKIVLQHLFDVLSLSKTQEKVIVGRFIKSLLTNKKFESAELKEKILREVLDFFQKGKSTVFIYEFDKRLNFSNLGVQKNRYL